MSWAWYVFSMEIRKLLSYRVDFWFAFLGQLLTSAVVGYYLWKAIFAAQGVSQIQGFDLDRMVLYYLLAPVVMRIVYGLERGGLSAEIYEGSLNRYLVYPVPVFFYKYLAKLAYSAVSALQFVAVIVAFAWISGDGMQGVSAQGALIGLLLALVAGLVYFTFYGLLELVAFWADNVWSLMVMLRMTSSILGGALIPIAFFPAGLIDWLEWTPFPYFISLPVELAMGRAALDQASMGLGVLLAWQGALSLLFAWVWSKGLKQYSGVGI